MDSEQKVPLILFSSGLDSSYLLQEKLKEGDVEVLYVRAIIGEAKMAMEQARQDKIISILQKETGHRVRARHVVDLGKAPFGNMEDHTFTQPPMWIMGALIVSDVRKHTELCIGYVVGDQVMPLLANMANAWENLQAVSKFTGAIPVKFPLYLTSKLDVLKNLHPEVIRNAWFCERPHEVLPNMVSDVVRTKVVGEWNWNDGNKIIDPTKVKRCGRCDSCITMATALFKWKKIAGTAYWRHLRRTAREEQRQKQFEKELAETKAKMADPVSMEIFDFSNPHSPKLINVEDPLSGKITYHGDSASY
jgi:hypothetical protein